MYFTDGNVLVENPSLLLIAGLRLRYLIRMFDIAKCFPTAHLDWCFDDLVAEIFIDKKYDDISWMEGRIDGPHCQTNGKYVNWGGDYLSCYQYEVKQLYSYFKSAYRKILLVFIYLRKLERWLSDTIVVRGVGPKKRYLYHFNPVEQHKYLCKQCRSSWDGS